MYRVYVVKDIVRVPPEKFKEPLEKAALEVLKQRYENLIDPNLGMIVLVYDVKVNEEGHVVLGDGATYHETTFKMLTFVPVINEVVEGPITGIKSYGAFINLGPVDGLIHVSQILDERVTYSDVMHALVGEQSKRFVKEGDIVRARITSISLSSPRGARISLTMRQPYLGKLEWIEELRMREGK